MLGEQRRAFDGVFELANVPRPVVAQQHLLRFAIEAVDLLLQLAADAADEPAGQRQDVFLAIAQRRHVDGHDVQAVVEVFAKQAIGHHRRQVAVGGGDETHVHLDRAGAAETFELVLLQHAQNLGLRARAHVADFVEEQRAAVGLFEAADALPLGAA